MICKKRFNRVKNPIDIIAICELTKNKTKDAHVNPKMIILIVDIIIECKQIN